MSRNNTLESLIFEAKKRLKKSGAGEYALDSRLFMMKATGLNKSETILNPNYILSDKEAYDFERMVSLRENGVPTQYITGFCEFMGRSFFVDENVLIPRPDTEVLVETVIEKGKMEGFKSVLDIGTGSGCIAISLSLSGFDVTAADISQGAVDVASKNAKYNKTEVKFVKSDLFSGLEKDAKFDAIVSNPPYIPTDVIETLMREVKEHEPKSALDGGNDGLDFYRRITDMAREYLNDGGYVFYEIGYDQSDSLHKIFEGNGFVDIKTVKDYGGNDRVVFGKYKRRGI